LAARCSGCACRTRASRNIVGTLARAGAARRITAGDQGRAAPRAVARGRACQAPCGTMGAAHASLVLRGRCCARHQRKRTSCPVRVRGFGSCIGRARDSACLDPG